MATIIVQAAETWPAVIAGLASGLGGAGIVALVTSKVARKRLEHDRDMRDLQFLRETLAPIAEHAIGWDAFTSLHFALDRAGSRPADQEWQESVRSLVEDVSASAGRLRLHRRVLMILLGPQAEVATWLGKLASDGEALVHVVRERVEAGGTTPEITASLGGLWLKFGFDQSRFIEHANKAVGLEAE